MKNYRLHLLLFALLTIGLSWNAVAASSATAQSSPEQLIRTSIDKGLVVLKDNGLSREQRREKIRRIMLDATDMNQVASLSLGRYKSKFSPEQLKAFTEAFSRLIFNTYIGHIETYSGGPVGYGSTSKISDNKVAVPVRVQTDEGPIAVDFSLVKGGETWKIYDVKIEQVSLVNNYRSQFSQFLVNKTPDALIEQLQKKVTANEKKS